MTAPHPPATSAPRDIYDEAGSAVYDRLVSGDTSELAELVSTVRAAVAGRRDAQVLELACGSGRITVPLVAAGFDVYALDLSPTMIELLRSRLTEQPSRPQHPARLLVASMVGFEVPATFDAVLLGTASISLLHHPSERRQCFASVLSHLRAGGVFALTNVELPASVASHTCTDLPDTGLRLVEDVDHGGRTRHVRIVPADGGLGCTLGSNTALLDAAGLRAELHASGFTDVRLRELAVHDDGRRHQLITARRGLDGP